MHNIQLKEVYSKLNSSNTGLSQTVADARLKQHGKNKLDEGKKKSWFARLLAQFKDLLILILLASCAISVVFAIVEKSTGELFDAAIILVIVVINAVIGLMQESKAEKSMEALKNLTKPFAKVLRDNKICKIKTEDLVVGDIVVLEAGDIVPADLRLIEVASLQIQESALTGESFPIEKNTGICKGENIPLGDQKNMAFMSGVVTYGRGRGIVVATGMETQMGKIANQLNKQEQTVTPLTKRINKTSKIIAIVIVAICIFIFVTDMMHGVAFTESFMVAVAIAVCAIPEGLPASMTITMALGVQRMSGKKAIVRNLPAVETLGSTEIICSDKTGTLTLNQMTVQVIYTKNEQSNLFNRGILKLDNIQKVTNTVTITANDGKKSKEKITEIVDNSNVQTLLRCMLLCNDTQSKYENSSLITVGDPTETALVQYGHTLGQEKISYDNNFPRVGEVPFDSARKLMTTVHAVNGKNVAYVKGAVDNLIKRCTKILDNGKIRDITRDDILEIQKTNSEFGKNALRVLGYAYKNLEPNCSLENHAELEKQLTFVGLSGMIDPPRKEVAESIKTCKLAGITPVMITGDHKDTAFAIAKQLGIANDEKEVLTGAELEELDDKQLDEIILNIKVYARVNPEHKTRIVKAFKARNKVVAMTGDGVNDAPSIKAADIGIGMGITGTDVTKGVSDIILTDDNFATIVGAVEEGRRVYSNIIKIITFLLATNVAEVILLTVIIAFMNQPFFGPALILWINFVTDSLPALALGTEKAERDVMLRKPNNSKGNLFKGKVGIDIIWYSVLQAIITFAVYFIAQYAWHTDHTTAITMCFITLVMCELFHSYNLLSDTDSLFSRNPFENKFLNWAFVIGLALTALIVVVPMAPIQEAFGVTSIDFEHWMISIAFAFTIIPFVELSKLVVRSYRKRKNKNS